MHYAVLVYNKNNETQTLRGVQGIADDNLPKNIIM